MTEIVETTPAPPPGDSGVCEWLSAIPMASSAGNTLYSLYEGSKGYSRASDYALGTIETSVKFAAGTVAPLVKKLDKPSKSSHALNRILSLCFVLNLLWFSPFSCSSCNRLICCKTTDETRREGACYQV